MPDTLPYRTDAGIPKVAVVNAKGFLPGATAFAEGESVYRTVAGVPKVALADAFGNVLPYPSVDQLREKFIHDLLSILGDTRLLWLPKATDTTTSVDESLNQRVLTYESSIASLLSEQGLGYGVAFDGSSQSISTPDATNLSFGNGTTDSAFSGIFLGSVTDTATSRRLISKWDPVGAAREWLFYVEASTDTLRLNLYDESVDVSPLRVSNAPIIMGAITLFGFTYSASTGGATAANDITLYQNGLAIPSSASNNASYVAMEDTAAPGRVGSEGSLATPASRFQGTAYLAAICQKNLSASDHWAIKKLINYYFALNL